MRVQEPYPYLASCAVLVVALALAGGLAVAEGCRRLWARVKEAKR